MDDRACVEFLQWALPVLKLRWAGFRKVRRQVCKRLGRRLRVLGLPDIAAYQGHLQRHCEEWTVLDGLCRITISRYLRDRRVFSCLQQSILPELVERMNAQGRSWLRLWSAGCAAGEEPYSLAILWELAIKPRAAEAPARLEIVATDSDQRLLERAAAACYPRSSVRELPADWRSRAFVERAGEVCLRPPFRRHVEFLWQDVRVESPPGAFDLILCRNLAFTYFDDALQRSILRRLALALRPEGFLVIGIHETLPQDQQDFAPWSRQPGVYQRRADRLDVLAPPRGG